MNSVKGPVADASVQYHDEPFGGLQDHARTTRTLFSLTRPQKAGAVEDDDDGRVSGFSATATPFT
jgi:hypothetical protein